MINSRTLLLFCIAILFTPNSAVASEKLTLTLMCEGMVSNIVSRTPKPERIKINIEEGLIFESYFGPATSVTITEDKIKAQFQDGFYISINRTTGEADIDHVALIYEGFICKKAPKKMF